MALLKKKTETTATADEAADAVAPAPEDLLGDAGGGAGDDPPDLETPKAPVQTVEAAPDADDLLRMFQDGEAASNDLKPLLDLTDDVEITELVDELQTLASALGARGG